MPGNFTAKQKKKTVLLISTALLITIFYFLFHFHFMQRYIDHDQIIYYYNVYYSKNSPFVNPHHLHFEISGKFFHEFMLKYFGEYGFTDLAFNLRLRSLLFGCIGIFSVILLITGLTGKLLWGIISSLLIGFTHGYLLYSPKIDTAIFSSSWILVVLLAGFIIQKSQKYLTPMAIIYGIILFMGIMLHQYLAISCVASFFSLITPAAFFSFKMLNAPFEITKNLNRAKVDRSFSSRYSAVIIMTLTTTILTVGAYFYAGRTYLNLSFEKPYTSWNHVYKHITFQEWIFFYKVQGDKLKTGWGQTKNFKKTEESIRGLTDAFISPRKIGPKWNKDLAFNYDIENPFNKKAFIFNQVSYFIIIFFTGTLLFFPFLWKRYGRNYLAILINLAGFTFLGTYWEPFYLEFWLIPSMLMIIMIILLFNYFGEQLKCILSAFSHTPFYAYILFFFILIAAHNMQYYLIPHTRNVYYYGISTWKDNKNYYKKLNSRPIYKNFNTPYKDIYNKKDTITRRWL